MDCPVGCLQAPACPQNGRKVRVLPLFCKVEAGVPLLHFCILTPPVLLDLLHLSRLPLPCCQLCLALLCPLHPLVLGLQLVHLPGVLHARAHLHGQRVVVGVVLHRAFQRFQQAVHVAGVRAVFLGQGFHQGFIPGIRLALGCLCLGRHLAHQPFQLARILFHILIKGSVIRLLTSLPARFCFRLIATCGFFACRLAFPGLCIFCRMFRRRRSGRCRLLFQLATAAHLPFLRRAQHRFLYGPGRFRRGGPAALCCAGRAFAAPLCKQL